MLETGTGGRSMGWTGERVGARFNEQVRESNEQVRAGAQASKLPAPPPAHPDVHQNLRIF